MDCEIDMAADVETFASAFEQRKADRPDARVEDCMPPRTHPAYKEIGLELLRIDLELSWDRNRPVPLDDYRHRFPEILSDRRRLERLAYEEYRQRRGAGQAATPAIYRDRYDVEVSGWPSVASTAGSNPPEQCSDQGLLSLGTKFGEFELVEELGRGAFARVFLARQTSLANRPVALKISRGRSVESDRLAQLQHANIVPIYSAHQAGDLQALCMPYLGRHTLAQVITQTRVSGRLPRSGRDLLSTIVAGNDSTKALALFQIPKIEAWFDSSPIAASIREHFEHANYIDAVLWIVARLADGLAHAHERGVLHRDLKPANVLFSDDGRPMILDFNLSEQLGPDANVAAAVGGTLPYMSPEQLESLVTGAAVGVQSDVYSLGVMLFELLTGRLPIQPPQDASPQALAVAIADRRRPSISARELNPQVSRSIAGVVARCLASRPEQRYASADQLREDLDRHLEHLPLAFAPDRSPGERACKWARRHPRLASATSIGLVAMLAIAAMSTVWLSREGHFGRVEAVNRFHDFSWKVEEARLPLSIPGMDADAHAEGASQARALLATYGVLSNDEWRRSGSYLNLTSQKQRQLDREFMELLHALANSSLLQASARPVSAGRKAMLDDAKNYNLAARNLAASAPFQLQQSLDNQRRLIDQISNDAHQLSPSQILEHSTLGAGVEAAARRQLHQRRFADALPLLVQWRDRDPRNVAAWTLLGVAHAGLRNPAEAEECFTTASRLRPQFPFSYFQRGIARHQLTKYEAAAGDFSRYLELRGFSPAALINRALAYEALGRWEHALADLNAALAAGAQQTRVYFIRAAVRQKLKDSVGAKEDFEKGLALTPTDATSWAARGMAQLKKSPEAALGDFREAMRLDPANRIAAQNILHVLLDRLHRDEEALAILEQIISANPRDAHALLTRSVLHARRGNAKRASADATAAMTIQASPLTSFQAACAFARISDDGAAYRSKAFELLAQALGAQPSLAAMAATDPDLAPLRDSEDFERIMDAAEVIRKGGASADMEATASR